MKIYKATLKTKLHPRAYKAKGDLARCTECGGNPEPCESCKASARAIAAVTAEWKAKGKL